MCIPSRHIPLRMGRVVRPRAMKILFGLQVNADLAERLKKDAEATIKERRKDKRNKEMKKVLYHDIMKKCTNVCDLNNGHEVERKLVECEWRVVV